ncbi:MAG: hypothetical protein H6970_01305 [Gammaproteobacteria bacterium]|nr:hypothetical protein [Gammaproteobacteria bacterium]MCP5423695.1 hypothetical protein [Gammaproteobacteria bacterium]
MNDKLHESLLRQDAQALVRLAKLTQALKHLGAAAEAVNLEAAELAEYLSRLLDAAGQARPAPAETEASAEAYYAAFEGAADEPINFQDMERRQRYYAGLPPVDAREAAFQQAMRESERRGIIAQGGLPLDDDD